jgi:tetratricopeptide (TPR) repeat protein
MLRLNVLGPIQLLDTDNEQPLKVPAKMLRFLAYSAWYTEMPDRSVTVNTLAESIWDTPGGGMGNLNTEKYKLRKKMLDYDIVPAEQDELPKIKDGIGCDLFDWRKALGQLEQTRTPDPKAWALWRGDFLQDIQVMPEDYKEPLLSTQRTHTSSEGQTLIGIRSRLKSERLDLALALASNYAKHGNFDSNLSILHHYLGILLTETPKALEQELQWLLLLEGHLGEQTYSQRAYARQKEILEKLSKSLDAVENTKQSAQDEPGNCLAALKTLMLLGSSDAIQAKEVLKTMTSDGQKLFGYWSLLINERFDMELFAAVTQLSEEELLLALNEITQKGLAFADEAPSGSKTMIFTDRGGLLRGFINEDNNTKRQGQHLQLARQLHNNVLEASEQYWQGRLLWRTEDQEHAHRLFIEAAHELAGQGSIDLAMTWLERAKPNSNEVLWAELQSNTERHLEVYIAQATIYERYGRYSEATKTISVARQVLKRIGNEIIKIRLDTAEAWVVCRDPHQRQHAKNLALTALAACKSQAASASNSTSLHIILEAEADAYIALGWLAYQEEKWQKALEHYQIALDQLYKLKKIWRIGGTLGMIGIIKGKQDQFEAGESDLRDGQRAYQAAHNQIGQAHIFNNLGAYYGEFGKNQQATESFQQAIEIQKKMNNFAELATLHINVGVIAFEERRFSQALTSYKEAERYLQQAGHPIERTLIFNLAEVHLLQEDFIEANRYGQQLWSDINTILAAQKLEELRLLERIWEKMVGFEEFSERDPQEYSLLLEAVKAKIDAEFGMGDQLTIKGS